MNFPELTKYLMMKENGERCCDDCGTDLIIWGEEVNVYGPCATLCISCVDVIEEEEGLLA